jgi:hypothetical protein
MFDSAKWRAQLVETPTCRCQHEYRLIEEGPGGGTVRLAAGDKSHLKFVLEKLLLPTAEQTDNGFICPCRLVAEHRDAVMVQFHDNAKTALRTVSAVLSRFSSAYHLTERRARNAHSA